MLCPRESEAWPLIGEFIEHFSQLNHFADPVCLNKCESGGISSEETGPDSQSVAIIGHPFANN